MRSVLLAVVLAVLIAPALVVFSPVYFPETLFVVVCAGALVGIVGRASSPRALLLACGIAAAVVFALGLFVFFRPLTPVVLAASVLEIVLWLFVPLVVGSAIGHVLRRRFGMQRGPVVAAAGALVIATLGVLLMFMVAPREAANAPDCTGGDQCARTACSYMAERRRLFALERVTQYGAGSITCVYVAWGGIEVGTVYAAPRAGASWEDGWWPRALRFWTP